MSGVDPLIVLGLVVAQVLLYRVDVHKVVKKAPALFIFYLGLLVFQNGVAAGLSYFGAGFFDLPAMVIVAFLASRLFIRRINFVPSVYGMPAFCLFSGLWLVMLPPALDTILNGWRILSTSAVAVILLAVMSAIRERLNLSNAVASYMILVLLLVSAVLLALGFSLINM